MSYLSTDGLAKICIYTDTVRTDWPCKLAIYWVERLQELKMCIHIHLLWVGWLYASCDTHTHTHSQSILIRILWLTPMSKTQDISTCSYFSSGVHHGSTQGNLLLLQYSSMFLNKQEGSPVVLPCLHKIPLHISVEISQDVTVNKTYRTVQLKTNK